MQEERMPGDIESEIRNALVNELRIVIHAQRREPHGRSNLFWAESRVAKLIVALQLRELVPDLLEVYADGPSPGWHAEIVLSRLGADEAIPRLVGLLSSDEEFDGVGVAERALHCLAAHETVDVLAAIVPVVVHQEAPPPALQELLQELAFERWSAVASPLWESVQSIAANEFVSELAEEAIAYPQKLARLAAQKGEPAPAEPHSQAPGFDDLELDYLFEDGFQQADRDLEVEVDRIGLKAFALVRGTEDIESITLTNADEPHLGAGHADDWCEDLARFQLFPRLKELTVNYCDLSNRGVQALLDAGHLANTLELLDLEVNAIDQEGAAMLVEQRALPRLNTVVLHRNPISAQYIHATLKGRYRVER
jgi:hypothetical protein